jgi:hypothetical protein
MDAGENSGVTSIGCPAASSAGTMSKRHMIEAAAIWSIDFARWAPGHTLMFPMRICQVPSEDIEWGLPSPETECNVEWIKKIVIHEEPSRVKPLWVREDVFIVEHGANKRQTVLDPLTVNA